jgi:hypothetical protein
MRKFPPKTNAKCKKLTVFILANLVFGYQVKGGKIHVFTALQKNEKSLLAAVIYVPRTSAPAYAKP